jgi:hypothetical protein
VTKKFFIGNLLMLVLGISFMPDWDLLYKLYQTFIVVALTLAINILFQSKMFREWAGKKIREWVVKSLIVDVMQQVMNNPDISKLIEMMHKNEMKSIHESNQESFKRRKR